MSKVMNDLLLVVCRSPAGSELGTTHEDMGQYDWFTELIIS